ncbi:MAG TPA: hypothetical protein VFM28_09585 [Nitrososphaeraceae archaeon]|nr:hypothetical protein [Nitrososphaeraceae archaeon]
MSDESQKGETHHLEDTKQDEFDDDEEEEDEFDDDDEEEKIDE